MSKTTLPPTIKQIKVKRPLFRFGKEKCFRYKAGECGFSHGPEDEYKMKKVPTIDENPSILKKFAEFKKRIFIPEKFEVKGAKICKLLQKEGNGDYPKVNDKIIFRSYGMVFKIKTKEEIEFEKKKLGSEYKDEGKMGFDIFADNRINRKTLKVNPQNGATKKNAKFYHYILSSMKENEEAYFRIHPRFFLVGQNGIKEKIKVEEAITLLSDDVLKPENYIYYFFKIDRIEGKDGASINKLNTIKNAKEGIAYMKERMQKLQKKKIDISKKKYANDAERSNAFRKLIKEYNPMKQSLNSKIFASLNEQQKNEVKGFNISINLRSANIALIVGDYIKAIKYTKFAIRFDPYSFKARYYQIIAHRRTKNPSKALIVLEEIEENIKKKLTTLNEKEKKLLQKEKGFLKKIKRKQNERAKAFGKGLSAGFNKGKLYENIEKEIDDELEKKFEFDKKRNKKPWFGPNGEVFYVDSKKSIFDQLTDVKAQIGINPVKDEYDEEYKSMCSQLEKEIEEYKEQQEQNSYEEYK